MANIFSISFLVLLTANTTYSQLIVPRKAYVGAKLGFAIPFGDLSKKEFSNPAAEFADVGPSFEINIAYKLGKHLGWTAMLQTNFYQSDDSTLKEELDKSYPTYQLSQINHSFVFHSLLMGGLLLSVPLDGDEKISIESRAMAGPSLFLLPSTYVSGEEEQRNWVSISRDGSSPIALSYLIGTGFRLNTSGILSFIANVDYLVSNPKIKDRKTRYIHNDNSFGGKDTENEISNTYTLSYRSFNITAGVAIRFARY